MERILYKGFEVILGDADTEKCKEWKEIHWKCTVKDKLNRKQMSFDVFGSRLAIMKPLRALYQFCDDAYSYSYLEDIADLMKKYGYETYAEAKKVYSAMEKAYYKCRKFIGDDDDIYEIVEELREEWG